MRKRVYRCPVCLIILVACTLPLKAGEPVGKLYGGPLKLGMFDLLHPVATADEKWGYVDDEGTEKIKPRFESASSFFRDGKLELAVVKDRGKYGYIDRIGNFKIPATFDGAGAFHQGRAWVLIGDKVGFINTEGQPVIRPIYRKAGDFSQNLAPVLEKDRYSYINPDGKEMIPPLFDLATNFSEGLAAVKLENKFGYINTKGDMVIKPTFDAAGPFTFGLTRVKIEGRYRFIDRLGNLLDHSGSTSFAEVLGPNLVAVGRTEKDGRCDVLLTSKEEGKSVRLDGMLLKERSKGVVVGFEGNQTIVLTTVGAKGPPKEIKKVNNAANFFAQVKFESLKKPGAEVFVLKYSEWILTNDKEAWLASHPPIPESPTQTPAAKFPTGIRYQAIFKRDAQRFEQIFVPEKNPVVRGNL